MTTPMGALDSVTASTASSSTIVSNDGDDGGPPGPAPFNTKTASNPLSFLANVTLDMFGMYKAAATPTEPSEEKAQVTADETMHDVNQSKKASKKKSKSATAAATADVSGNSGGNSKKKASKTTSSLPTATEKKRKRLEGKDATQAPRPRKARKGDAARVADALSKAFPPSETNPMTCGSNAAVAAAVVASSSGGHFQDEDDSSNKEESVKYNEYLASYASAVKDAQKVLDRVDPSMPRFSDDLLHRQRQLEHEMETLRREELAVLREREISNALREQELMAVLQQHRQREMMANMEASFAFNDYASSLQGPMALSRLELQIQQEMQRQQQALLECRLMNGSSLGSPSLFASSGLGGGSSMGTAEASYLAGIGRPHGAFSNPLVAMQGAHELTAASRHLTAAAGAAGMNQITSGSSAPAAESRLMMNHVSSPSIGAAGGGSSPHGLAVQAAAKAAAVAATSTEGTSARAAASAAAVAAAAPKRLAPARGVFNKNVKTQDEVLDHLARASCRFYKGDTGNKSGQRFRSYQCEQWTSKFQELLRFKGEMGNCQVPHAYKKNIELARWVKRQRYQYKLMVEGKQSTMTTERVKLLEDVGFIWDSHAATWEERLNELRDYFTTHGDCNVPSSYRENPKLATWIKCQRRQFKLLQEGKTSNMTLERMTELERTGFCWRVQER